MDALLDFIQTYGWLGVIAFVVTVFATPLAANLARRLGVLDIPDQKLKPHARPTPYLGGAAICLGWSVAIIAAIVWLPAAHASVLRPILLGGIAMSLLGLADDVREVPPKLRLALQAVIAFAVVLNLHLYSERGFHLVDSFFAPVHLEIPGALSLTLSFLLGVFIILGACNSTNLIDGLDGLCAGVTAVISLGFFVLATYLAVHEWSREANATRLIVAIAILGATLGFLPLNFNPAKIFMGDAGSVLLGYTCGIMILLFDERARLRWLLGGLMIFGLPIFDTTLAIIRRWRSGRSLFAGDRSHFYDQLVDRGLSVRKVVIISYLLAAFYAALGCASIWIRLRYMLPLYGIVTLATAFIVIRAGMVRAEPPSAAATATPAGSGQRAPVPTGRE